MKGPKARGEPVQAEAVLEAVGIERRFGTVVALAGVDLRLNPGQLYGLVGPDGAGKTTLIRILVGLIAPDKGRVRLAGHDPLREQRAVRGELGYMPQAYSLYGDLSVDENLLFFSRMFDLKRAEFSERRQRLLHITRLAPFTDRRADALSGGMYKKLALACALLHRPRILLLDEPTNGVDPVSRRELWNLLREFVDEGMAVLISTPYMDEAARCHQVGLMHLGRKLLDGPPDQLLAGFPHHSYQVEGCSRQQAERILEGSPGVLGFSPAGGRIRVVVESSARGALEAKLGASGGRLIPTRPDFEDLFLSRLHTSTGDRDAP
jgi:ABC-2 type transport system ATP-binding protein